eukprot:scaffold29758_cov21-Tisochrysis_lutea.AAC.2
MARGWGTGREHGEIGALATFPSSLFYVDFVRKRRSTATARCEVLPIFDFHLFSIFVKNPA